MTPVTVTESLPARAGAGPRPPVTSGPLPPGLPGPTVTLTMLVPAAAGFNMISDRDILRKRPAGGRDRDSEAAARRGRHCQAAAVTPADDDLDTRGT